MALSQLLNAAGLFPCPLCRTGESAGINRFCLDCLAKIRRYSRTRCPGCGAELSGVLASCEKCLKEKPRAYLDTAAVMDYAGIGRDLVLALKNGHVEYARPLAALLAEQIEHGNWSLDCITAVPLHWSRALCRSYNQSELLARCVGEILHLPFFSMRRIRRTQDQKRLSSEARHKNMADAFFANPRFFQGKKVLLIDDVLTTGATLHAAALALKKAGAKAVFCGVIARA